MSQAGMWQKDVHMAKAQVARAGDKMQEKIRRNQVQRKQSREKEKEIDGEICPKQKAV